MLPSQTPGVLERAGLRTDEVTAALWVVEQGGRQFRGAAAANRVLWELGGAWRWLGSLYLAPPIGWLEDRYYARVARRRAWF